MNADPRSNLNFTLPFAAGSQSGPVFIGTPVRYASRIARLVSISKSHRIEDRIGWSDVELTVIGGQCEIQFANRSVVLASEESITIPAMIEHSIMAISDVRVVVSYAPNTCRQNSSGN